MSGFGAFLGGLSGGTIGASIVSLILETKKFDAGLVSAKGKLTASTATMDTSVSKFATVAKAGFAVAAVAAVKFAVDAVGAALEAQQAQTKLANSIENSAKVSAGAAEAFTKQADALRDLTGVDDEAIIGAQAFLVQMGLTEKQVKTLTPLIVDLSAKMGVDLETAAKAVGKSVNGTVAGLSRMGVVVDKTRAQTDAYGATLDALGVAQGFAEQRAKDEPWRVLGAQYEEMAETLGTALIPLLKQLVPVLTLVVDGLTAILSPIVKVLEVISSDAWDRFADNLREAGATAPQAAAAVAELQEKVEGTTASLHGLGGAMAIIERRAFQNAEEARGWAERQAALKAQLDATKESAVDAGRGFRRFAHLTEEGLKDLRSQAKADLAAIVGSVDGFQRKWSFTATSFNNRIEQMRAKSRELRTALDQFSKLKGVPEDFQAWLIQQGPDAIRAFVQNSAAGRDDIIADWKKIDSNTNASKRAVDRVSQAVRNVGDGLRNLDGKTADITVRLHLDADSDIPPPLVDELLSQALVHQQI